MPYVEAAAPDLLKRSAVLRWCSDFSACLAAHVGFIVSCRDFAFNVKVSIAANGHSADSGD
jgi:hypothetical protein